MENGHQLQEFSKANLTVFYLFHNLMPPPQPQPQPPPPPPPLPQFECAKCGKSFPEKRRLEDHWRTKKLRKYIHICQHCNNRFETNANLEQHQIGCVHFLQQNQ